MQNDLPSNVQIGSDHIWAQVFESAKRFDQKTPALFLDRDGVIVKEVHYLHKPQDVELIEGAAELIAKANRLNIPVIVVTNQSGLARDMFGWKDFSAVQKRMLDLISEAVAGAFVDAVYACPFHKMGKEPFKAAAHEARKPNPGMLLRALKAMPIEASGSWIIGDKACDIEAGLNAGISGGVHVLTGHGRDAGQLENAKALARNDFIVRYEDSIADAIDLFD